MKSKAVALADPVNGIGEELAHKLPDMEGGHERARYSRAGVTVPLPPTQAVTVAPRARMDALVAARGALSGEAYAPAPAQDPESQRILDSVREERRGTLARFIVYLVENGVLEGAPTTFEEQHAVQKCAYLARELGAPLHYEFDFLENGAYSAILALDLFAEDSANAGARPFKEGSEAGRLLARIVRGRGMRTLQAMTFAMRDIRAGVGREEFVEIMLRERTLYERRVLEWAFDRVSEAIRGAGAGDE